MLGIIVEAQTNTDDLPNRIFYRLGKQTIIERVLLSAVKCDYAHKVILAMPTADRSFVYGNIFQNNSISISDIGHEGRGITPFFHGRKGEDLSRLYAAALTNGLTDVIRLNAENLFIPPWFINQCVLQYYNLPDSSYLYAGHPEFNEGFELEIMPFWMIANANIYCDSQQTLSQYLDSNFTKRNVLNIDQNHIKYTEQSLRFNNKGQLALLSSIVDEIDKGADISEVVEDINE